MDAPEPDQTPFASVTAHTSKLQRVRVPEHLDWAWTGLALPCLASACPLRAALPSLVHKADIEFTS
ncbi:hypothetical protein O9K51_01248 [Purpureocillium lavendulum]|uniref:Uncharacterized protein n=1 Tax=Purpureocillium lavendulum TaxID=1247861 RepID=A0AB34G8G9_9HYPO|nr:hypothetical protein O9K51_01248 [Purpureocillium lavendulum]